MILHSRPFLFLAASSVALAGPQGVPLSSRQPLAAAPAATGNPAAVIAICSPAVEDLASPGSCVPASSVPALGTLLPLGPELFVAPTGEVGLGTTLPEHALDVVGDVRTRSRVALGNDARVGDPGGFERVFDLSQTISDFSTASDWAGLRSWITLDPPNDLTGLDETFVYGHDLTTRTAPGSPADFAFVQGPWLVALHEGSGAITAMVGANAGAENREGAVSYQSGLAVQSTADSIGQTGWNACLELIGGAESPTSAVDSNYGIYVGSPLTAGYLGNNYGLYLADQTGAALDSFAIYAEGGDAVFGGNVGVGTSAPSVALEVAGDFAATGTKSFVQAHPTDSGKEIWFACLEGNEAGTYFRGTARLEGGRAVVPLPEDFALVTEVAGMTAQLTAMGPGAELWIESLGLDGLVVRGARDVAFSYLVNGVRSGQAGFQTIRERAARRVQALERAPQSAARGLHSARAAR